MDDQTVLPDAEPRPRAGWGRLLMWSAAGAVTGAAWGLLRYGGDLDALRPVAVFALAFGIAGLLFGAWRSSCKT
jgi:hypothetical protein